ncbi:MAG: class I SAM-dependent methyltransferase, partial [Calditrichota bacterium]
SDTLGAMNRAATKHCYEENIMDAREVGRLWEENAEAWTQLSRAGYDVTRDRYNTPTFLSLLPEVKGLKGLDLGCGEGHNTRMVAKRGAVMTALDIAPTFVRYANNHESQASLGIRYLIASGTEIPFADESFDFIVAFMSLMDMFNHELAVQESYRTLKPGGFFQFSIIHPLFDGANRFWVRDETGNKIALACRDYFDDGEHMEEWIFHTAPPELKAKYRPFKTAYFTRTLSSWLNLFAEAGFILESAAEPHADAKTIELYPEEAKSCIAPFFLITRWRKPM